MTGTTHTGVDLGALTFTGQEAPQNETYTTHSIPADWVGIALVFFLAGYALAHYSDNRIVQSSRTHNPPETCHR